MNLIVASVSLFAAIVVWWMAARRLTTRPWEAQGTLDGREAAQLPGPAPARIGLWVFLAVATSFFALLISAYFIRMSPELAQGQALRDWRPVAEPSILWLNTAALLASSIGMQLARAAVGRGDVVRARAGLFAGGVFALAFLAGQLLAWRQLQAAGYYAAGNPANAFFFVLTALHGLHLIGGLVVWGRTVSRLPRQGAARGTTRLTVELCAVYWHYLLIVWLVLFALLLNT